MDTLLESVSDTSNKAHVNSLVQDWQGSVSGANFLVQTELNLQCTLVLIITHLKINQSFNLA